MRQCATMLTLARSTAIYTFFTLFCAYGSHELETKDNYNIYVCERGLCPVSDIWPNCSAILNDIYAATSSFQHCALVSTLTSDICERCVTHYGHAVNLFRHVKKGGTDHMMELCREQFFSSGTFSAVSQTFANVADFWKKPSCDNCFDRPVVDNSTYNVSDDTRTFNELLNTALKCINDSQEYVGINSSSVCIVCRKAYDDANLFYDSLVKKSDDNGICFDIVAAMNRTRFLWGASQCSESRYNNLVLYATAAFFTLLAVLYYVCAYLVVNPRNTRLVQRKLFQRRRRASSAGQNATAKRRSTFYDNTPSTSHSINS